MDRIDGFDLQVDIDRGDIYATFFLITYYNPSEAIISGILKFTQNINSVTNFEHGNSSVM
jgi:hypothetical protein